MSRIAAAFVVTAGALLAPALAASGVIVIDPGGAPGAPLLQAALDVAQTGDILLLRGGDYSGGNPTASGKALVIAADAGHDVVLPGLHLSATPYLGKTVVRGLRIEAPATATAQAFDLFTSNGTFWVEDCSASGAGGGSTLGGRPALLISGGEAFVTGCQFHGALGTDAGTGPGGTFVPATAGGAGLAYQSGRVAIFDTVGIGGQGGDGPGDPPFTANGGQGANLTGAPLWVMGCWFQGGDEGDNDPKGSTSGAGLTTFFGGPLYLRDVHLQAGGVNGVGIPGLPLQATFTPVTTFPAPARIVSVASPVRELQAAAISVRAVQGDFVTLRISMETGMQLLAGKQGMNILGSPNGTTILPLGLVTDASGQLQASVTMPRLPIGVDGLVLFTQLSVVSAQGEALLGSGSALLWLSAAL